VLVQHVDHVDTEVDEALVADLADVLGPTVDAEAGLREVEAELRRDDDLVAKRRDRLAEEDLVGSGPHPVELRRVEERDAELVCVADRGDAVLVAPAGPVGHRHAHRAESECRNLQALTAELALLHGLTIILSV